MIFGRAPILPGAWKTVTSWTIAIILGVVEGLTEFIPVSSTGHLIIVGNLLGFTGQKAATFEVVIQLGAILSVLLLYGRRFVRLIPTQSPPVKSALDGWSGIVRIALATLPALVVGYLAHDFIKSRLFTPVTVTWALAVGGFAILLAERFAAHRSTNSLDELTLKQAFGIGLFQTLSLWPGTSRAAATIVGGLLLGLDRKGAAEFSFLIAVPVMAVATGYDFLQMRDVLASEDLLMLAVGFSVSFAVALATVAAFVRLLGRWSLAPFAWYRIAVAPIFYSLTHKLSF
ncbi:MAG TPA: undecaprenyl-diphosphate phosphatase [Candidatus Acidoferrales bacterium]|nr:undecaprenyl-diphosphate phosphatase [Candidatus Acidoferrales bacterium]